MKRRLISILLLFLIMFTSVTEVFASSDKEVHFLRSRVDLNNKTIKIDILKTEAPDRSAKDHAEVSHGDFSYLKTDESMNFTHPDLPLYHSNFSQTERDFSNVSFPNGDPVKINDKGIVEYAGSGEKFIFSFPYNSKEDISKEEKKFAKRVESEMNKSIGKMTSLFKFKDEDTFLQFWSNFVSTNNRINGNKELVVGGIEYNYYIGDPNGTTYDKDESALATRNNKYFYHPDKDVNGNILMYIWTGSKSLDEMEGMDYLNVTKVVYAIPSLYHSDNKIFLVNKDLEESATKYYTLRMVGMQALMNYKLKNVTVQASNYVDVKESKLNIFTKAGNGIVNGINSTTNGVTGIFNTHDIISYSFITNAFFDYINPFLGISVGFLIIVILFFIAIKWGSIVIALKSGNPNKVAVIQQSIQPLVSYILTSVIPLSFFSFFMFFSRSIGLTIYDIMPGFDVFLLGTADTIGGALSELLYASILTGFNIIQLLAILLAIGLIVFAPLLLLPTLIKGKSDYIFFLQILGYLVFAPISMLILNMMIGMAGTFTFPPLIMSILCSIVAFLLIKIFIKRWELDGILDLKNSLSNVFKFGGKVAGVVGGAIAGDSAGLSKGSSSGNRSTSGNNYGNSVETNSGSSMGGANDLNQALASNSNNLGARQSMERGSKVGAFGSVGNTFNEVKDSFGREFEGNMENLKTRVESKGREFNPDSTLNKGLAGTKIGAKVAGKGIGKAIGATPNVLSGGLRMISGAMNTTAGIMDGDAGTFGRGLAEMGEVGRETMDGIKGGIYDAKDYVSNANASQEYKKYMSPVSKGGKGGVDGIDLSTHDANFEAIDVNMQSLRNEGVMGIGKNSGGQMTIDYDYNKATPRNQELLRNIKEHELGGQEKSHILKNMGISSVKLDPYTKQVSQISIKNPTQAFKHMGISKLEYNSRTDQGIVSKNTTDKTPISFVPIIPETQPSTLPVSKDNPSNDIKPKSYNGRTNVQPPNFKKRAN